MRDKSHGHARWGAAAGVVALTLVPLGMAVAQTPAEAALQTLLGGSMGGATTAAAPAVGAAPAIALGTAMPASPPGQGRTAITVAPGQSLRLIIRQHFPNSPFTEKFLQRAFLDLNPGAFVGGQVHRLAAGATLWIPSMQDLLGYLQPRSVTPAVGAPAAESRDAATDRKHWVRYP